MKLLPIFFLHYEFFLEYMKDAFQNIIHNFANYFILVFIELIPFQLGNIEVHAQIALSNTGALFGKIVLSATIAI